MELAMDEIHSSLPHDESTTSVENEEKNTRGNMELSHCEMPEGNVSEAACNAVTIQKCQLTKIWLNAKNTKSKRNFFTPVRNSLKLEHCKISSGTDTTSTLGSNGFYRTWEDKFVRKLENNQCKSIQEIFYPELQAITTSKKFELYSAVKKRKIKDVTSTVATPRLAGYYKTWEEKFNSKLENNRNNSTKRNLSLENEANSTSKRFELHSAIKKRMVEDVTCTTADIQRPNGYYKTCEGKFIQPLENSSMSENLAPESETVLTSKRFELHTAIKERRFEEVTCTTTTEATPQGPCGYYKAWEDKFIQKLENNSSLSPELETVLTSEKFELHSALKKRTVDNVTCTSEATKRPCGYSKTWEDKLMQKLDNNTISENLFTETEPVSTTKKFELRSAVKKGSITEDVTRTATTQTTDGYYETWEDKFKRKLKKNYRNSVTVNIALKSEEMPNPKKFELRSSVKKRTIGDCETEKVSADKSSSNMLENEKGFRYPCEQCGNDYVHFSTLTRHIISVHTETQAKVPVCKVRKQVSCALCTKRFHSQMQLKNHMTCRHTDKFSCNVCEKRLCSKASLICHIRRKHTGETPFRCLLCGKAWITKFELSRHMRKVHIGFACEKCGKRFFARRELIVHSCSCATKMCPDCGRNFSADDDYQYEMHISLCSGKVLKEGKFSLMFRK